MYFTPPTQDAEYAYFNFPELLSLRTALILHLQHNNTIDVRTQFSGCLSQEWKNFLEESYPYFLIVADEGLNDLQTHLFNFLIIQSWSMKVNAVLSSGQASDVLRLYAYFMLSRHRQQTFFKQVIYIKIFIIILNNFLNYLTQFFFYLFYGNYHRFNREVLSIIIIMIQVQSFIEHFLS